MEILTPTAIELWNDKEFIEKRIEEQESFIWLRCLQKFSGEISKERFRESINSAHEVLVRFSDRLTELEDMEGMFEQHKAVNFK